MSIWSRQRQRASTGELGAPAPSQAPPIKPPENIPVGATKIPGVEPETSPPTPPLPPGMMAQVPEDYTQIMGTPEGSIALGPGGETVRTAEPMPMPPMPEAAPDDFLQRQNVMLAPPTPGRLAEIAGGLGSGILEWLSGLSPDWGRAVEETIPMWEGVKVEMAKELGVDPASVDDSQFAYTIGSLLPYALVWPMAMNLAGTNFAMAPGAGQVLGVEEMGPFAPLAGLDFVMRTLPGAIRYGGQVVARKDFVDKTIRSFKQLFGKIDKNNPQWSAKARQVMTEAIDASDMDESERLAIKRAFGEAEDFNMAEYRAVVANSIKNPADREVLYKIGDEIFETSMEAQFGSAEATRNAALRLARSRELVKRDLAAQEVVKPVTVERAQKAGLTTMGDKVKLGNRVFEVGRPVTGGYILKYGKQRVRISPDKLATLERVP